MQNPFDPNRPYDILTNRYKGNDPNNPNNPNNHPNTNKSCIKNDNNPDDCIWFCEGDNRAHSPRVRAEQQKQLNIAKERLISKNRHNMDAYDCIIG